MTTCDTCRFWARDGDRLEVCDEANDWEAETTGHYKCRLFVLAGFGDMIKREFAESAAIVLDGEGYKGALWTLRTFGCNAYEVIPNKGESNAAS